MNSRAFTVAFCCEGNTCRSKMAEAVLLKKAADSGLPIAVQGFGLNAVKGSETQEKALTALRFAGYPAKKSPAVSVREVSLAAIDLIVCMEATQKRVLTPFVKGETALYAAKELTGKEISDPFGMGESAYCTTLKQIEALIFALLNMITEEVLSKKGETV